MTTKPTNYSNVDGDKRDDDRDDGYKKEASCAALPRFLTIQPSRTVRHWPHTITTDDDSDGGNADTMTSSTAMESTETSVTTTVTDGYKTGASCASQSSRFAAGTAGCHANV